MDKEMLLNQAQAELNSAIDGLVSTGRVSERVIILTPEGTWRKITAGEQPPESLSGFRPDTYIIVRQMAHKTFSGGEEGKMVEEMRRGRDMMSSENDAKVMEMLAALATSPNMSIFLSQRFRRQGPKLVLDGEPRIIEGYMESWSEDAMESTEFNRVAHKIFDSAKDNLSRDKQLFPLLLSFPRPAHSEMAIIPIQDKEDIPWIVRDMKPAAYFFVSEAWHYKDAEEVARVQKELAEGTEPKRKEQVFLVGMTGKTRLSISQIFHRRWGRIGFEGNPVMESEFQTSGTFQ